MTLLSANRKALVAPDSFKGMLSAAEAAQSISDGLERAGWSCEAMPVADGGEGTLETVANKLGLELVPHKVPGPLGEEVTAKYGINTDRKLAVVEMAEACGLGLVAPERRNPTKATTQGVGELIRAAMKNGARQVVVAAGGSATCDAGRGALEALGAVFEKDSVDLRVVKKLLRGVTLRVACDVTSPLIGPQGAAQVYAPQKGATEKDVAQLERRLKKFAHLAEQVTGRNPVDRSMAGAGGGLAGGLWAFAGAELKLGSKLVLELLDLNSALLASRFAVTGEGSLDSQTLAGKACAQVATAARQRGVPCSAIVGKNRLDPIGLRQLDLHYVYEAPAKNATGAKKSIADHSYKLGLQMAKDFK